MVKTPETKRSNFKIIHVPHVPMSESLKAAIQAEKAMERRAAAFLKDKTITLGPWPPKEWSDD
jgi:hypothetical protein